MRRGLANVVWYGGVLGPWCLVSAANVALLGGDSEAKAPDVVVRAIVFLLKLGNRLCFRRQGAYLVGYV